MRWRTEEHPKYGTLKVPYRIEATYPKGECLMSANAANRVKDAVERVVTNLEKAADGTAERLNRLSEEAMDKFHRVERSVADPLEQALKGLDELLGSNTNFPPQE